MIEVKFVTDSTGRDQGSMTLPFMPMEGMYVMTPRYDSIEQKIVKITIKSDGSVTARVG